jgi:hypothetical protein
MLTEYFWRREGSINVCLREVDCEEERWVELASCQFGRFVYFCPQYIVNGTLLSRHSVCDVYSPRS